MTIDEFAEIVKAIDPDASRYQRIRKKTDVAYTVWSDYGTSPLYADGVPAGIAKKVQVDYFTFAEDDPVATRFYKAFSENDDIVCKHMTDFEEDSRYIHHIFDCEVIMNYGAV